MENEKLYIKLKQIPGGVSLSENFSGRFVACLEQSDTHGSISILQGLISVVGELNRDYFWDQLYQISGCSLRKLNYYLDGILDDSRAENLFDRGRGLYAEEIMIKGFLPVRTGYSFSVFLDTAGSGNLNMTIRDGLFRHIRAAAPGTASGALINTAAAFAENIFAELYFPALKLLTADPSGKAVRTFLDQTLSEQFVPMA